MVFCHCSINNVSTSFCTLKHFESNFRCAEASISIIGDFVNKLFFQNKKLSIDQASIQLIVNRILVRIQSIMGSVHENQNWRIVYLSVLLHTYSAIIIVLQDSAIGQPFFM